MIKSIGITFLVDLPYVDKTVLFKRKALLHSSMSKKHAKECAIDLYEFIKDSLDYNPNINIKEDRLKPWDIYYYHEKDYQQYDIPTSTANFFALE